MSLVCSVLLQVRDAQWQTADRFPLSFLHSMPLLGHWFLRGFHPQHSVCTHHLLPCTGRGRTPPTMPAPLPSPPDSTSPEGGSSSLLRPVTMCMLRVPQMEINNNNKKSHPPQKEKIAQLAPAMAILNCPSDSTRHLHALLAIHFSLCRT